MNTDDVKKEVLNKLISVEIRRQEEKTEEEQIAGFVKRLLNREERHYIRATDRIQREHRTIVELIEKKAEEARHLHLGLALKAQYLAMEETNLESEIRYYWKALLPDLFKHNTEEENG